MKILKIIQDPANGIGALSQIGSQSAIEHLIINLTIDFSPHDIIVIVESNNTEFYENILSICSKFDVCCEQIEPVYSLKNIKGIFEKYNIEHACIIRNKFYFLDNETLKHLEKNISKEHDITSFSPYPLNNSYRASGFILSKKGIEKAVNKQILSLEQIIWEFIMTFNIIENFIPDTIPFLKFNLNERFIKKLNEIVLHLEKNNIPINFRNIAENQNLLSADIQLPKEIRIELTNNCNLSCSFCPHTQLTRPKGNMSKETFSRITSELKHAYNKIAIEISGFGEPLLHPDFFDMLNVHTFPSHFKTYLYTNGTLMNKPRKLLNIEFDCIFVSVDAYFPKTYEKLKHQPLLKDVLKNIEKISKIKSQDRRILSFLPKYTRKNQLAITMIKTIDTKREYSKFFIDWGYYIQAQSDFKYHDKKEKFIEQRRHYEKIKNKTAEDHFRFYQHRQFYTWAFPMFFKQHSPLQVEHTLIEHFNDFNQRIQDISYGKYVHFKQQPCAKADNSLTILWNGDVVRCAQDFNADHVIGNINETSIEDIWKDNPYRDLKEEIFKKELCDTCSDYYYM